MQIADRTVIALLRGAAYAVLWGLAALGGYSLIRHTLWLGIPLTAFFVAGLRLWPVLPATPTHGEQITASVAFGAVLTGGVLAWQGYGPWIWVLAVLLAAAVVADVRRRPSEPRLPLAR